MTTISIFNGKERDKRYAILLWHDVETGRDTIARLDETDAATLRDALTAWLDAPRLAARKPISSCTVIDVDYSTGVALIKSTAGEWGVIDSDGLSHAPGWLDAPGMLHDWYATEAEGRAAYRNETGKVSCESCARFIDHADACVDEDGIYTCVDETACSAAIAALEAL